MKTTIFLLILTFSFLSCTYAQDKDTSDHKTGMLMVGLRNTVSAFSDDQANGMGTGGQFRIRFSNRMNSDWFADYITTDISGLAKRTDYHIGWSVLYYPFHHQTVKGKFTPYVLAGHCFDWTQVAKNGLLTETYNLPQERFSSAVQSGAGVHYNLTDHFDLSLTAQYMLHFGKDIHTQVFDNEITGNKDIIIKKEDPGLEGHLLINLSLNVDLVHLWKKQTP